MGREIMPQTGAGSGMDTTSPSLVPCAIARSQDRPPGGPGVEMQRRLHKRATMLHTRLGA